MIVYAESSAVLSWLLGESRGEEILQFLEDADFVVTSDLTLIECDRVLHRGLSLGELDMDRVVRCRTTLRRVVAGWVLLRISTEIVERARGQFPQEPIRSLDAIHLASALDTIALIPETNLLSLDERVRRCGRALGIGILPAD